MNRRRTAALGAVALAGLAVGVGAPAYAGTVTITNTSQLAAFDVATAQQPENLVAASNGALDLTFNYSLQVGVVSSGGALSILATLPQDSANSAAVTGIVRMSNGDLYVNYAAGSQSGIWEITPSGSAQQVVALPDAQWLNGLAYDSSENALYATDSNLGAIWKISLSNGTASIWSQSTDYNPSSAGVKGTNGLKIHNGNVYVSNTALGTLYSVPINSDGSAGAISTVATGVTGIDDFSFASNGDVIAAQDPVSEVSDINLSTGTTTVLLTASAGLSDPTSVLVTGTTVYITNGAYFTKTNPSLTVGTLNLG